MTLYQDSFTRSGPLAGVQPDVGDGTTAWLTSGSTVQCDGAQLTMQPNSWAALAVGSGDADLTVQVTSGGSPAPGVFVRSPGPGAGGWRLEGYQQTYSTGYYQTVDNFIGQYRVGAYQVDSRDQNACPPMGSLSTRSQCGNSNFPSTYSQACGSYGSRVDYYLQGVYQSGTCQVYVPGSYTVYFSQLINPAGTVVWSGQTAYAPSLRLRAQGASITAHVNGSQVATATDSDQASRLRNRNGLYTTGSAGSFDGFSLDTLNTPPNAPVLTAPGNNSVVDRTAVVTLGWQFNDPDVGDTQSKYDLRYRKVGATSWTEAARETPTTSHALAAGTLEDGAQFEWQVRTYDSQGVVGPWSATSYFRAGTPPPAPTWTAPTNNGQIPTEQFIARWSSASQVAYELQVYSDSGGSPNLSAGPLLATGAVTSNAREQQLTFSTNNVVRHLRLRIQAGGLWSQWATVRATVSYTPPPTPVVNTLPDDERGCIILDLRTPAPTGTQPAVLFCDVYRQVGAATEERVTTRLASDGRWIDWTPASGLIHRYRAVAFGANGVTSTSDPTA